MRIIIENTDKQWIHSYLKEILSFPEYYGENLDALYDCLTDVNAEVELELRCDDPYIDKISKVFQAAANENPNLKVQILKQDELD